MSHRFARAASLLFGLALLFLVQTSIAQESQAPRGLTPLDQVLDQDGSLDVPDGFSGSLNARGYRMVVAGDGSPRFVQAPETAADTDENWDDRFGIAGLPYGEINALVRDGGDLYVGGWFQTASNLPAKNVAKWDGRAWSALGDGIPDGQVYALAMHEGDLYVGGSFTQAGDVLANGIARWDGTTWHTVGDGMVGEYGTPTIYALATFGGDLYAAGEFVEAGGVSAVGVARWDGANWSALGSGLTGDYETKGKGLALTASSTMLYVGGDFQYAGGETANSLAAWSGTTWSTVGGGLEGEFAESVQALAVDGDRLYVGGSFIKAGSVNAKSIAVWNTATSTWSALGQGVRSGMYDGEVYDILPVGGDVYVVGNFDAAGSAKAFYAAKWNGAAWSPLVQDGLNGVNYQPAHALAHGPDGSIYVAGKFYKTGENQEDEGSLALNAIGQWDGSRWKTLGQGVHWGNSLGFIYAVAVSADGKVYVGGQFSFAGSAVSENIAMWDGQEWHALGKGVNQFVYAIATRGDDVFVGGKFTQAGSTAANYVAKWSAATKTWAGLGSGMNGYVYDLAVDEEHVYAVGDFTAAGGVPAIDMARWDGGAWSKLGAGIDFTFNAYLYSVLLHGGLVYVGGDFQAVKLPVGSSIVNGLLAWEEANDTWYAIGNESGYGVTRKGGSSDVWGQVNDMVVVDNQLYVGGRFDKAGGQVAANGVARFDFATQTWAALGTSIGGDYTQEVHALTVNGPDLFVGGRFTSAGGVNSSRIARWNLPGQSWHGMGRGMVAEDGSGQQVYDLATFGNAVYAGGYFETAGGKSSSSFAQWNLGGQQPGDGPSIQVGPTALAFGETPVGEAAERTVTITNASWATGTLTGAVGTPAAPFSVVSGGGDFSLTPGQSRQVTVRFSPTAAGLASATLSVTHNAANQASTINVALSGTGEAQTTTVALRNFDPGSEQKLYEVLRDQVYAGYVFGTNKYADRSKSTALRLPESATQGTVSEVRVWFAHKKSGLANQSYTLKLYNGTTEAGPSGAPIFSQSYRLADVNADADPNTASAATVHTLPQPVPVGATFFVAIDFGTYTEAEFDMAAISATVMGEDRVPEVWEQWEDGTWANASDVYWGGAQPGAGSKGWHLWIEATAAVGTASPNEPEAPEAALTLAQNAPNPFGTSTSIRFTLPVAGPAVLKVFDALGREVATLVDGPLPAGPHTAMLDASSLASGMYFYTLLAGQETQTRKMILVR